MVEDRNAGDSYWPLARPRLIFEIDFGAALGCKASGNYPRVRQAT